jgi:hypothetical protein
MSPERPEFLVDHRILMFPEYLEYLVNLDFLDYPVLQHFLDYLERLGFLVTHPKAQGNQSNFQ